MDRTPRLLTVSGSGGRARSLRGSSPAVVALVALWTVGASACADLWGFQDGVLGTAEGGQGSADAGWLPDALTEVLADGAVAPVEASEGSYADVGGPVACSLSCVAAPPPGWSGPYELSETADESTGLCSDSAYPVDVYEGFASPVAPPASCECTCGPATGSRCEPPTITLFHGAMCNAASQCAIGGVSPGACVGAGPGCVGAHMQVSAPVPVAGTCVPSAATHVPDAGWMRSARLCGVREASATQCAAGEVCTPAVESELGSCIAMAELSACPPGPYAYRHVYYAAATDSRACTECSCGAPSTTCTGGSVATFVDPVCSIAPQATWSAPQSCADLRGDQSALYQGDAVPNPGPCKPLGGMPSGQLTPVKPTTVCCTR